MSKRLMYKLMTKLHAKSAFDTNSAVQHKAALSMAKDAGYKYPNNALYTLARSGYIERDMHHRVCLSPLSIEMLKAYGYETPEKHGYVQQPPTPTVIARPHDDDDIDDNKAQLELPLVQKLPVGKESTTRYVSLSVGSTQINCKLPVGVADEILNYMLTRVTLHRPSSSE